MNMAEFASGRRSVMARTYTSLNGVGYLNGISHYIQTYTVPGAVVFFSITSPQYKLDG